MASSGGGAAKGFAQYTATGTAFALTATPATGVPVPDGAVAALIQAEAQDVRWRPDNVAPTAAIGMLLKANTVLEYTGDLNGLRLIAQTAGAILNVSYYGTLT